MKTIILCTALLGPLLVSTPQTARADDDTNPSKDASFELQLAPDQGGWNLFERSECTFRRLLPFGILSAR